MHIFYSSWRCEYTQNQFQSSPCFTDKHTQSATETHLCIFTPSNTCIKSVDKLMENPPTIDAAAADHLVLQEEEEMRN